MVVNNEVQKDLVELLSDLWYMDRLDIAYDENDDFVQAKDKLISLFASDIKRAIRLLDSLDFDNAMQASILRYIPEIVKNLKTFEEQDAFIEHIKMLQKKFPRVKFSGPILYAELFYHS